MLLAWAALLLVAVLGVVARLVALPFGLVVLAVKGRLGRLWRFYAHGERSDPTLVAYAPMIAFSVVLARLQPWPDLW
jgi:hypothetical protein